MGMQKYRFDRAEMVYPNGAVRLVADWMGGITLAGLRNCPVYAGKEVLATPRMVYVTGEPDSYFSQPAVCQVKGKRIKGFISSQENDKGEFIGLCFYKQDEE